MAGDWICYGAWGFALGFHIGSFDRERLADVFFLNA
jgi:hypothetical protein